MPAWPVPPVPRFVHLKHYGTGKCSVGAQGDPRFHDAVKRAICRSLRVEVTFDLLSFASEMKARGIPDDAAREFLRTANVNDDVYLHETNRG